MPTGAPPRFDLYATLGVDATASAEHIRRAYWRVAKERHPDHASDSATATRAMQRANIARAWLTDPVARAAYDLQRSRAAPRERGPVPDRSASPAQARRRTPPRATPPRIDPARAELLARLIVVGGGAFLGLLLISALRAAGQAAASSDGTPVDGWVDWLGSVAASLAHRGIGYVLLGLALLGLVAFGVGLIVVGGYEEIRRLVLPGTHDD
jgi:hypothetical protein